MQLSGKNEALKSIRLENWAIVNRISVFWQSWDTLLVVHRIFCYRNVHWLHSHSKSIIRSISTVTNQVNILSMEIFSYFTLFRLRRAHLPPHSRFVLITPSGETLRPMKLLDLLPLFQLLRKLRTNISTNDGKGSNFLGVALQKLQGLKSQFSRTK